MRRFLIALGVASGVAALAGCPVSPPGLCDYGACDPPDGAVVEGGFDAPPGCDLSKDPKDSPACVDGSVGVFVSASGSDANDGSKEKPVATIAKGLSLVGTKKRIYVCEGTYAEDVTLAKSVSIYGGFACAGWGYTGTKPTIGKTATALKVDGVTGGATIADVELKAAAGGSPGESSVAATVRGSTLNFTRVKLTAGKGADGLSPNQPAQAAQAADGKSSTGNMGGEACTNTCSDGNSVGGKGGDVGNNNSDPGLPALGGGAAGLGNTACGSGGLGGLGTAGSVGSASAGASSLGVATTTWTPAAGVTGTPGSRGQGGGGGGARAGGGGAGGCGGCGGLGGPGGGGGGASIALLAIDSTVTLVASELTAGDGGNGGKGAAGGLGQLPGAGGGGFNGTAPVGCGGGDGAQGGIGGTGGGGAGGISVGVLYKGTKPTTDSATDGKIAFGKKGDKGLGGSTPTNDGIDGVAQAVLQIP